MLCVSHEMGFARTVADRVIFMDEGEIIEQNRPAEFFDNPQHERTKQAQHPELGPNCSSARFWTIRQTRSPRPEL